MSRWYRAVDLRDDAMLCLQAVDAPCRCKLGKHWAAASRNAKSRGLRVLPDFRVPALSLYCANHSAASAHVLVPTDCSRWDIGFEFVPCFNDQLSKAQSF